MSRTRTSGLAVLGLLSLIDVAGPLVTDGDHPPMSVALAGAALGLASLVLIAYAIRGAARAVPPLIVLRGVSAVTAAPALFVSGVPAAVRALAAIIIALTAAGCWLVVSSSAEVPAS
jgi:hypothetical protein